MIFPYGEKEIEHLSRADEAMARAVARIGRVKREVTPDPFEALIVSVVSQQISMKAADTVESRLRALAGGLTPNALLALHEEQLRSCGLSGRKAGYIHGIAHAAATDNVDFDALRRMPDAELIAALTALPGVGVWTAEMLMIFSFMRPDVVSYRDLGIRGGMMRIYGLDALSKPAFEDIRARYSPYGSVASLYLWAAHIECPAAEVVV